MVNRLILLLFSTRPVVLIPVWGFALFGFRIASGHNSLISTIEVGSFGMILLFSLSVAAVYLINQIEDFDVDSKNGGYPLLVKSGISLKLVKIFTAFLSVISIATPLIWGYWSISVLSLVSIVIGLLYSLKPTYFTGRPLFDFISNGIGYGGVAFIAGWIVAGGEFGGQAIIASLPYIVLMFAGSISSTLPDIDGDKEVGKITTAVKFGSMRAHILATIFIVLGTILGYLNHDLVATVSGLLSLPIYILYVFKPTQSIMESTYKVGGGLMMFTIGLYYPVFIVVSLTVGTVTLLYFRVVHSVTYPSLLPVESNEKNSN